MLVIIDLWNNLKAETFLELILTKSYVQIIFYFILK